MGQIITEDTFKKSDEAGLFKSQFNDEGIRIRALRKKENERWEILDLPKFPNGVHFAYIYTLEQAIDLGIKFRRDWKKPHPDKEKIWVGPNVYIQKDDWVITEEPGPMDEYWVMQVLWRNVGPMPYIRTATGSYFLNGGKVFDGADMPGQYSISGEEAYQSKHRSFTQRERLLIMFISKLILEKGYYSKEVVELAYKSAYKNSPSWQKVILIMRSDKIMSQVAKILKEKLKEMELDEDWVLKQLKEMGENDHPKDARRRLEVVKLVGRMNDLPMYEENPKLPPGVNNFVASFFT